MNNLNVFDNSLLDDESNKLPVATTLGNQPIIGASDDYDYYDTHEPTRVFVHGLDGTHILYSYS